MISSKLAIALTIGTLLMMVPVLILSQWYIVKKWKGILVTILLTITGTVGTYILFYIENQRWGGISFYGAVFLVPVVFVLISLLMRISYGTIMDICAPAECMMLAFMKVQCLTSGCCGGRILFVARNGFQVVFPSQVAEMLNGVAIMVILMGLGYRWSKRGYLYPLYMIIYGITRFVLNFFRQEFAEHTGVLPPYGTIWSIVAIVIGCVWLWLLRKQTQSTDNTSA